MSIKRGLVTSINQFLKSPNLRTYVDKRVVNGMKIYVEDVVSSSEIETYKFSLASLNQAASIPGQTKVENILKKYKDCSGTEMQMKFISNVVLTVVIGHLKLHELSVIANSSGLELIGMTDVFIRKLQDVVQLTNDVESDFDSYMKEASKGDIRYIEVGLKRLLATEVDSIV